MLGLIIRRLVQLPLIVLAIYTIALTLAWAIPGNPMDNPEGRRPPPEVQQAMLKQYNLDSFPRFYFSYLDSALGLEYARDLAAGRIERDTTGAGGMGGMDAGGPDSERIDAPRRAVFDLGPSLSYEDWRVNEIIAASLPVSVTLGAAAILLAVLIGVPAGVVGAVKPNGIADLATLAVALIGISLPSFVVGTALLLVFGVLVPLFPVGGWGGVSRMVLPAVTLSLPFAAYIARLTRMGMLDQLSADYVQTARAKGAPEWKVILQHALKNAFLPVLSFLGPATALAMTGSFVVERVFRVPGIGQHFVNAVQNKDLFLIIGVVLVFATMLVVFNLIVDVLYRWVDPRIDQS